MKHNNHKLERNIILDADSYKNDHGRMLKYGVEFMESSIVPRKPSKTATHVVATGHQYLIKAYLTQRLTKEMIDEAQVEIEEQGYEFDRERWEYILEKYDGKLPLLVRAVPEGTVLPVGTPVVRIVNTDRKCAWLVSYIETMFQRGIWYATTVASIARELKEFMQETMLRHSGESFVDYHLHNFGSRGCDSYEDDITSGMAHALLFNGSDSMQTNRNIKFYYNTEKAYTSSVIATEHSVTCSNSNAATRDDFAMAEKAIRLLEQAVIRFEKTGKGVPIVSVVIDTYDAYRFVREFIGTRLKNALIELGKRGGRLVLRPDSGNPLTMPIDIIKIAMEKFGYTVNAQGYKVLPSYIGVLQGDGINQESIREIVANLDKDQISIQNLLFGMGGKLTHPEGGRDHFSFAMKATAQYSKDDGWEDLFKDPITDVGKRSLKGRVTTFKCNQSGKIFAERVELQEVNKFITDMMVDCYKDGVAMNESTFDESRVRANYGLAA